MKTKVLGSLFAVLAAGMIVATPAVAYPRHPAKRQVCKVVVKGHGKYKKRVKTCHWVRR